MIEITWLGHAVFTLKSESGEVLLLDPWIESNPAYPKEHKFERVDAIALSHGHYDHVDDVIPIAKKFKPSKVVGIYELAAFFEKKGVKNTVGMNKGGTVDLGFVKLTMTHAIHSCSIKDGDDLIYGGEAAGYVLTFQDGRRAYFAGDTQPFSDMKLIAEFYGPELAFLPIGGLFTMDPEGAAYAARAVKARKVIPMHYATFPPLTGRPEELAAHLEKDGISVWTLKAGEPVSW